MHSIQNHILHNISPVLILISDVNKDICYQDKRRGVCIMPLPVPMTRSMCCCTDISSFLYKRWGAACELCPLSGTPQYKQLCDAMPDEGKSYELVNFVLYLEHLSISNSVIPCQMKVSHMNCLLHRHQLWRFVCALSYINDV